MIESNKSYSRIPIESNESYVRIYSSLKYHHEMSGTLTWDPFTQELCVNFMDLTISYDPSTSALVFTVYEKKENFYLYLPPRSCHAPGIIYGTILGTLFRYRKICTRIEDFYLQTEKFFHRLVNHPNFNYFSPKPL